ncbi:uncharacterized protein BO66DRAFT_442443 [Aspergillus aculeatinus CBS 121060]|uniref:Uncharacterized protein n=1 Tax=Aspergillus aculeatinus CBS 121060 TaxID=1448322 RepID=A0ACD1GXI1_9EURO|nr:hypothetical protein BO66DRAFT_442443 [Aspergillus aculeatinus CBS 121060]RAH66055.1 hypothetical protein BO66DRAFT_442443 [Aspergillus aculeatinus CBS 121060]
MAGAEQIERLGREFDRAVRNGDGDVSIILSSVGRFLRRIKYISHKDNSRWFGKRMLSEIPNRQERILCKLDDADAEALVHEESSLIEGGGAVVPSSGQKTCRQRTPRNCIPTHLTIAQYGASLPGGDDDTSDEFDEHILAVPDWERKGTIKNPRNKNRPWDQPRGNLENI